jgi:spore germination cell wall hydrolase CwlJ-like protein
MFHEANFEPIEGKIAVAQVVMERVKDPRYPSTACGVVFQPKQFSYVERSVKKQEQWEKYVPLGEAILKGLVDNPVPGATHFHANYVNPYWSKSMVKVKQIGHHIFYDDNVKIENFWESGVPKNDPVPVIDPGGPSPDISSVCVGIEACHGAAEVG